MFLRLRTKIFTRHEMTQKGKLVFAQPMNENPSQERQKNVINNSSRFKICVQIDNDLRNVGKKLIEIINYFTVKGRYFA